MQRNRWLAAAAGSVLLAGGLLRGRMERFEIAERSMAPALLPGEFVLAVRSKRPLRRGDIVVFEHPDKHDFHLVKRVIGLPGERLEIANGQVHIDGLVLAEPWADGPTFPDAGWDLGPEDVFVLGDRRADSADDGRTLGPIGVDPVPWRVVIRYWPPGRTGRPGPG